MINLDVLTRPFLQTEVKQRKSDTGKTFDYVEAHSVIARLNEAFQGGWNFRILQHQIVEGEVIILGELSGDGVVKQQFGSAVLDTTEPGALTVGDSFKAAASDALKKCATGFGVALELYGSDNTTYSPATNGDAARVADEPVFDEDPATDKQRAFLEKIVQREELSDDDRARLRTALAGTLTKSEASDLISGFARKRAA